MTEQDHNDKRNGNGTRTTAFVAIIGAFLGAGGSTAVVFNTPLGQSLARPDPYTGSEAAALEERVSHLEVDFRYHITNHPDVTNEFDRRITRLETQIDLILTNQQRIINRLDQM